MSSPEVRHEEGNHPGPAQYVRIALVLFVITVIEVAIYYVEALEGVLVPMLIVFSLLKFILVVLWFMHLRFDTRIFTWLFVSGIVLTLSVFAVVLLTFFLQGGAAPAPPGLGG
jgi:cytochrome c oxidase subunit IV